MIEKNLEIVVSAERSFGSMGPEIRRTIQKILLEVYRDVRVTEVRSMHDLHAIVTRKPDLIILGTSKLSHFLTYTIAIIVM